VVEFSCSVSIPRPVEDVYALVSDPLQLWRWNSAVDAVRPRSGSPGEVGSTFVMERELPGGRAEDEVEVLVREPPREFAMRTTSGPTPFVYRYRFSPDGDGTRLELDAAVELQGVAGRLDGLAKRAVTRGVAANLRTLRGILR
jgi:uncharacterized protein YndB with AHSA1/START domain